MAHTSSQTTKNPNKMGINSSNSESHLIQIYHKYPYLFSISNQAFTQVKPSQIHHKE